MAKICSKCGRKIGWSEYSYNGECENCYKGIVPTVQQDKVKTNSNNNNDTSGCIFGLIFIGIIIFIIMFICSSAKQDAERRKQKELREFNTQLHQDPSTWDKEQRDRYDSFTKWDYKN